MGDFFEGMMPKRNPNLESRRFDDEFVVLDTETNQAHVLEGTAARVWQAIEDGSQPDLLEPEVEDVIADLAELGLVSTDGLSRRTLLKVGAASGLALAGITSLVLPAAAMALSDKLMHIVAPGGGMLTVPGGATVSYTMIGGGGGSGSDGNPGHSGGMGGQGDIISGTIKNMTSAARTLAVFPGTGGLGGQPSAGGTGGTTFGSSGVASSFGGGTGGSASDSGGGGGGASVIYDVAAAVAIVVAGGGGGGSGSPKSNAQAGNPSETTQGQGTILTATPLSAGGNAGFDAGGGGAGAGGGTGGSSALAGGNEGASSSPNNPSSAWTITVQQNVGSGVGANQVPTALGTAGNGGAAANSGNPGQDGEAWFNGTFSGGTGVAGS